MERAPIGAAQSPRSPTNSCADACVGNIGNHRASSARVPETVPGRRSSPYPAQRRDRRLRSRRRRNSAVARVDGGRDPRRRASTVLADGPLDALADSVSESLPPGPGAAPRDNHWQVDGVRCSGPRRPAWDTCTNGQRACSSSNASRIERPKGLPGMLWRMLSCLTGPLQTVALTDEAKSSSSPGQPRSTPSRMS